MEAKIINEEVLITADQDVINEKLADGTYRVLHVVPLPQVETKEGQPVQVIGTTMVCYVLAKLEKVGDNK